jgi:hypothetical protein
LLLMVKHHLLLPLLLLLHLELLLSSLSLNEKILELSVFSLVNSGSLGFVGLPNLLRHRSPLLCDDLGCLGEGDSGGYFLPHVRAEDGVAMSSAPLL